MQFGAPLAPGKKLNVHNCAYLKFVNVDVDLFVM